MRRENYVLALANNTGSPNCRFYATSFLGEVDQKKQLGLGYSFSYLYRHNDVTYLALF
jgi:hypothetical protein